MNHGFCCQLQRIKLYVASGYNTSSALRNAPVSPDQRFASLAVRREVMDKGQRDVLKEKVRENPSKVRQADSYVTIIPVVAGSNIDQDHRKQRKQRSCLGVGGGCSSNVFISLILLKN